MLMLEYESGVLMRTLAGIYACEYEHVNRLLLKPMMLGTDRKTRDRMLYTLFSKGFIEGLTVISKKEPIVSVDEDRLSITDKGIKYLLANHDTFVKTLTDWQEDANDFFRAFRQGK